MVKTEVAVALMLRTPKVWVAVHVFVFARFSEMAPLLLEIVVPSGFTPPRTEEVAAGRL